MLTIMRRELTLLTHERPAVLVILLGAATAYSLLIGNLYRGGIVQRIPVAVCDLDDSPVSRELIRAVADADQYDFRQTVSDDAEAVNLLERGEVAAVLIIPEDFSDKFYRAESVNVAFLQDGSNTLQASYASAPIQLIGASGSIEFNSRAAMINSAPQLSPAPVTLSLRTAGNPTQSYMAFYMYGVMLMAAQVGMIMGFALSIHGDFRAGFFRRQTLMPLVAKAVLYLALSLTSVALGVFFLATFGNLTFRSGLGDMILICAAVLFAVEGLAGLTGVAPQIKEHAAILFAIGSVFFYLRCGFLFFDERPSVTPKTF